MVTISLRRATQLTFELQKLKPALVYLPAEEIAAHPDVVGQAHGPGSLPGRHPAPDLF